MTKRDSQAREYAAEADDDAVTGAALAFRIAEWLRRNNHPRAAASVVYWQDAAARLPGERRRHNDAMQQLLEKYYALRDGPGRQFNREGKPPAESSD